MAIALKRFTFDSDAEGLADSGLTASVAFAFDGTDGNSAGCVTFTSTTINLSGVTEKAKRASTGQTWQTWGVPAGATVTAVQLSGYDERELNNLGCTGALSIRIVDSSGNTVHSAGDLLSARAVFDVFTNWSTRTDGLTRNINSNRQASSTDVRLEIQVDVTTGALGVSFDLRLDNIELTIFYTTGASTMPTYTAQGAAIANLAELVFSKAYMYATIDGHTQDTIAFGALQNVKFNHAFAFAEMRGPESLAPVGVGVSSEDLTGDWSNGVIHPEQLMMLSGGSLSYDAPSNKTTLRKLVDQEPPPFNLRCLSGPGTPDLEFRFYRCLANSWNMGLGDREWVMGAGAFKVYGEASVDGGKLFDVLKPGNLTNQS